MNQNHHIEDRFSLPLFRRRGISLVKGKNAHVWDESGKEYIDCTSGHGVAGIGHANPAIIRALTEQAGEIMTCTGSFYHPLRAAYIERLVSIAPKNLKSVFLCNSGTESIEAALKFARISSGKKEFIAAVNGFHGRTMGALSATWNPAYRDDFNPLVPGFQFVDYNDIQSFKNAVNAETAAVILEIVQGEGGVRLADGAYLRQVQDICRQKGVLLIVDEVQTGFGRTGRMFACEHHQIEPDLLCLSKSIAGGFPMGAVLCSDKIIVAYGKHGSTFGGNPLACAVSLATINYIIENDLPIAAGRKGKHLVDSFKRSELSIVNEVRHLGLMIGIALDRPAQPYIDELQKEGVLVIPAGADVIRLLPPLTIDNSDIDIVVDKLHTVLSKG
ncbi:MAG: acetylornithine/succinylornithine family transaminase [Calditrichales bacterium]|nr:MAG: acetylornithine/succinylornithine family transaminase [Calditrichales bacterium]